MPGAHEKDPGSRKANQILIGVFLALAFGMGLMLATTCTPAGGGGPSTSAIPVSTTSANQEQNVSASFQVTASSTSATSSEVASSDATSEAASSEPSSTEEPAPSIDPASLEAETIVSSEDVQALGEDAFFSVQSIPDDVFARMDGVSFPADCPVGRQELSYIRLLHVDADGNIKVGEMVSHSSIGQELCDLFRQLYHEGYAIERVRLADDYNADDEMSMRDNNTSCFCCRPIEGSGAISRHSYGLALDINPLYNPYYSSSLGVLPQTAQEYVDRSVITPYTIEPGDYCYEIFTSAGYFWGGNWTDPKDYQHFEK